MNGGTETQAETSREVTLRKRTRSGQFLDRDISFEMRSQHLLGAELLPRLQPRPRRDGKFRSATMSLQRMSTEHHRNLIARQPLEWPVERAGRQHALCHLRPNEALNKEDFLKPEIRSNVVIERK